MKAPIVDVRPSSFWLCLIVALLAAGIAVVLLEPFQTANGNTAVVTYTRGVLHVTIPYHAVHSGDGKLTVEVLDPEDKVLGHAETQVAIREGYGRWQEDIRLDKALGVDEERRQGRTLSPEQLCPDDPQLRELLHKRITRRLGLHDVLDLYGVANTFEVYSGTHTSDVAVRFQEHVMPFFSRTLSFETAQP